MSSRIDVTGDMLPILTYHSISDEPGPTSIPPAVFATQMQAISDAGVEVVSLDRALAWRKGEWTPKARALAITFDDAFEDFAQNAHPVLAKHGFPSCVFAPTEILGGSEDWYGANSAPRKLMDWPTAGRLSKEGVAFGSHSMAHRDLTTLDDAALDEDLAGSRKMLEDRLGKPAPFFAPPFGHSDDRVRRAIARHYSLSVGVRLGRATKDAPLFDLPRIEMHYFRNPGQWRRFLEGRGETYFRVRQAARRLRGAAISLLKPAMR